MSRVFLSCCCLQTVYLRRCVNLTDDAVATLTQNCLRLEHLNLCGCNKITDTSLQLIAHNCKFLQSLNLSNTKVSKQVYISSDVISYTKLSIVSA